MGRLAKKFKAVLLYRDMTQVQWAEEMGKPYSTVRNSLATDNMQYKTLEAYADSLGCDVVFRDRETGKIFD